LPIDKAAAGSGLSKLWARRKIDDAEVARTMGQISQDAADRIVLQLALDHHLVTRLTSLVAVDKTPRRPAGTPLTQADIPLDLPAGWSFDKVFGTDDQSRAPLLQRTSLDSHEGVAAAAPDQSIVLPKTATSAELCLIAGLLLLGASLLCLFLDGARRRGSA
jgi:Ca-activated chloride channel family protein